MIYFVRHGQTDWNFAKKLQGQVDIELNSKGIEQAYQTKEKLKSIKFDKIFCSPLKRTVQTCKIITNQKFELDERIMERSFGEFEGLVKSYEDFWDLNKNQSFEKAESIADVEKGVFNFLDEVVSKYPTENILIVGHGGVGLVLTSYFRGIPKDGNYMHYIIDNCQVLSFDQKKIFR